VRATSYLNRVCVRSSCSLYCSRRDFSFDGLSIVDIPSVKFGKAE